MKWLVQELVAPAARRLGGQVAAAAVALGLSAQHESALAAIVAWVVISGAELASSSAARRKLKAQWGRN